MSEVSVEGRVKKGKIPTGLTAGRISAIVNTVVLK